MTRDEVAALFGTTAAEVDAEFKKGNKVMVKDFTVRAVIIAVPLAVGKPIGVEFVSEVLNCSSCDGLGKSRRCRWVRPDEILVI
jgi:hypothetical protein